MTASKRWDPVDQQGGLKRRLPGKLNPELARLLAIVKEEPVIHGQQVPNKLLSSTASLAGTASSFFTAKGCGSSVKSCWPGLAEALQLAPVEPEKLFSDGERLASARQFVLSARNSEFLPTVKSASNETYYDQDKGSAFQLENTPWPKDHVSFPSLPSAVRIPATSRLPSRATTAPWKQDGRTLHPSQSARSPQASNSSFKDMFGTREIYSPPSSARTRINSTSSGIPPLPKWLQREIRKAEQTFRLDAAQASTASLASVADENIQTKTNLKAGASPLVGETSSVEDMTLDTLQEAVASVKRGERNTILSTIRQSSRKIRQPSNEERKPTEPLKVATWLIEGDVESVQASDVSDEVTPALRSASSGLLEARLQNARKSFVEVKTLLQLNTPKKARVKRLDKMRRIRRKLQDSMIEDQETNPRRVSRPPPIFPTGKPEVDKLLEAFTRYDLDDSGQLDLREIRSAFSDIGLHPTLVEEKREITRIITEALDRAGGCLDFYDFQKLAPKVREVVVETKRNELEEWFSRGLQRDGCFDKSILGNCLEALGSQMNGDEDMQEVLRIFSRVPNVRKSIVEELEQADSSDSAETARPGINFPFFEKLVHEAQATLVTMRRSRERKLFEEHGLTQEQFDEFRSDLIALDAMFRKFDVDGSGFLEPQEVIWLLAASGVVPNEGLPDALLMQTMRRAKEKAAVATASTSSNTVTPTSAGWHSLHKRISFGWSKLRDTDGNVRDGGGDIGDAVQNLNFMEFLYLMRQVRLMQRAAQIDRLRELFLQNDTDNKGEVSLKDLSRLFRDLGLQPRTRQAQMEIKQTIDEVDANGDGCFSFGEFVLLVQRCQERLEKLSRIEEETYALSIGLPIERCRELRKVFADHMQISGDQPSAPGVLYIKDLRAAMDNLQRWYSSEELQELFRSFAREDLGGIDSRSFLRMMYAIEFAGTAGRYQQGRKVIQLLSSKRQDVRSFEAIKI